MERQPREYPKPAVGTGSRFDHTAQRRRPLLHTENALTKPDFVVECFTADLVVNPQHELSLVAAHTDARRGLTCVTHDISQCFLNDSKRCQINAGWQPRKIARNLSMHLQASLGSSCDEIAETGETWRRGARRRFMDLAKHI